MTKPHFTMQLTVATLASVMSLAGCGQKAPEDDPMGGGGMGSMPSSSGGNGGQGGEPLDYFPMIDGATYTYVHAPAGWAETITVSATTHEGTPAYNISESIDPDGERTESVFVQSGTKVLRVYKEVFDTTTNDMLLSQVTYRPGFIRADSGWAVAAVGSEFEEGYQRTETIPGSGVQPTEDRSHVYVLEGFEEVVTNAGRFPNCMRIRRKRTWQDDVPGDEGQEKRFWFAPGIGKVQEETPENLTTERLDSYSLP